MSNKPSQDSHCFGFSWKQAKSGDVLLKREGFSLAEKFAFLDEVLSEYDSKAWPTYGTGKQLDMFENVFFL